MNKWNKDVQEKDLQIENIKVFFILLNTVFKGSSISDVTRGEGIKEFVLEVCHGINKRGRGLTFSKIWTTPLLQSFFSKSKQS